MVAELSFSCLIPSVLKDDLQTMELVVKSEWDQGLICRGRHSYLLGVCGSITCDLKAKPNMIMFLYTNLSIYTKNRMGLEVRAELWRMLGSTISHHLDTPSSILQVILVCSNSTWTTGGFLVVR